MKYTSLEDRALRRQMRPKKPPAPPEPEPLPTPPPAPKTLMVYAGDKVLPPGAYKWRSGKLHLRKVDAEGKSIRVFELNGKEIVIRKTNLIIA
jgi:hypothetical protein